MNGSKVMEAVKRELVEALMILIEHGAGREFGDRNGLTPLILALDTGHPALIRCLIQGGANSLQQTTPKLTACDGAQGNCHAPHPRKPNFVDYSSPLGISYDIDLDMYRLVDESK
jgi:ankyrin repeat protein